MSSEQKADSLIVNEIFYSIQGESSYAGLPCVFIRLTGCNLKCTYCDTRYAFNEREKVSIDKIISHVVNYNTPLVEITGGEPLLQKGVYSLINKLLKQNKIILLETNGSMDISKVKDQVIKIMDIKCPSSGMSEHNLFFNIEKLTNNDEVKFVIGDKEDYEWAKEIIKKYNFCTGCKILFSPVFDKISSQLLTTWILKDQLYVRFQIQLHKYIWSPDKRGV